jgi:rhodanese-related sulfurtransferase
VIAFLMGLPTITPHALQALIEHDAVRICDVNSIASWRHARVPGARLLDPQTFTTNELDAPPHRTLVFYCSGPLCRKAPIAARRARRMGYADARVMSAGIAGWLGARLPVERGAI